MVTEKSSLDDMVSIEDSACWMLDLLPQPNSTPYCEVDWTVSLGEV